MNVYLINWATLKEYCNNLWVCGTNSKYLYLSYQYTQCNTTIRLRKLIFFYLSSIRRSYTPNQNFRFTNIKSQTQRSEFLTGFFSESKILLLPHFLSLAISLTSLGTRGLLFAQERQYRFPFQLTNSLTTSPHLQQFSIFTNSFLFNK